MYHVFMAERVPTKYEVQFRLRLEGIVQCN